MLSDKQKEQVISLWQEAFGDSREEIIRFLENCNNKKLISKCKLDKLFSMLFLVDCSLNGKECKYIYAASTSKERRGNGDMTDLLTQCKFDYPLIALIPADEDLANYYICRGFTKKAGLDELEFNEPEEIVKEYLLEGSSLDTPYLLVYEKE